MSVLLSYLAAELQHRWRAVRDTKDGGYSTETVLVTALLVTAALLALAVVGAKLLAKANSINLG